MKPTPRLFFALASAMVLAMPTAATAACKPDPGSLGVHFLDLKLPSSVNQSNYNGLVASTLLAGPTPVNKSGCTGWHSAVLELRVPDGCTQARVWVEYQGAPRGWTINLGDAPNNNGFGGNSGEPDSAAELQILGETLTFYTPGLGPGIVDSLAQDHLALTDGGLEIVASNQYVSWGQPLSAISTQNSELGFALPDPGAPAGKERVLYLGVNRVVSGPGDRVGCGARRVMVSFR